MIVSCISSQQSLLFMYTPLKLMETIVIKNRKKERESWNLGVGLRNGKRKRWCGLGREDRHKRRSQPDASVPDCQSPKHGCSSSTNEQCDADANEEATSWVTMSSKFYTIRFKDQINLYSFLNYKLFKVLPFCE